MRGGCTRGRGRKRGVGFADGIARMGLGLWMGRERWSGEVEGWSSVINWLSRFIEQVVRFTLNRLITDLETGVQESVSLKPVQKPVLIVAYDQHLQSRVTSDVDGEDVEMNAKASDSLDSVKCGTVTWKPKPVLFLVDAEYLQKGNMEANATANSDKHHSAINMDHLMRRTQGEISTTSQDNLNRAPEAEVDEVVKASESVESVQSVPSPSKAEPVLFLVPTAGYPESSVTRGGVVEDWGDLEETGGVKHYGPYIAMDEEDYRLWLQIELSAVEVEMNVRTSDFLFLESVKRGSSTVTWKPKSVLVLVPAEYLQKEAPNQIMMWQMYIVYNTFNAILGILDSYNFIPNMASTMNAITTTDRRELQLSIIPGLQFPIIFDL
ncbi:hypothetical protein QJS04_geneDACA013354 [Acorus gramineus]|uniref:Uncharacterized protein n=1 Tax=Acorus gramineus TaxID=55184 RepID=A0AAV9A994_ACOGR|nr:hypothetical protein QJS04_geneDACA013354 [Acorus gramineus]